jgi:hypothetical protein
MNIIQIPEPPAPTPAQLAARAIGSRIRSMSAQLVAEHKAIVELFWTDKQATPDEILIELASLNPANPARAVAVQEQSVATIAALAAIHGRTLDDELPPQFYVPPRPFVVAEDGTVTLATVEGLDPWGRPIPQPEPDPTVNDIPDEP